MSGETARFDPEELGDEMWALPGAEFIDEPLHDLYSALVSQLQTELRETPGAGVIEAMVAERVAFLYVYIRQREQSIGGEDGFDHDRQHKETTKLWHDMALGLSKLQTNAKDAEKVRDHVLKSVGRSVQTALSTFPPDERRAVAERLEMVLTDVEF